MSCIRQDIWWIVQPYLVGLIAHFVIFCITMSIVILMLFISQWAIPFCEITLRADPLVVKILVYASDLLIIGHFAFYLAHE